VARLSHEFNKVLAEPDVRAKIVKAGLTPTPTSHEQSDQFMRDEADMWGALIRDLNLKLD
jgi:tripartite-type tricarboxylate transporter receptor subunit TctC